MNKYESPYNAPDTEAIRKRLAANRDRKVDATASQSATPEHAESQLVVKPFPAYEVPESPLLKSRMTAETPPEAVIVPESPMPLPQGEDAQFAPERKAEGEEMVVLQQTEGGVELPLAEPVFKMDDAPAVPATAPEAKKWLARVWEQAKAYVAPFMERFSSKTAEVPQPVSAELEALRTQRAEWHDLAQQLFSPDKKISDAAKEAAIGKTLDLGDKKTYTIEKALGQGGFGAAFAAKDSRGNSCVVKLSKPFDRQEMFYNGVQPSEQEKVKATTARSLIMEVAALKRLNRLGERNPGPALLDAQFIPDPRKADQRIAAVVMEQIDGVSLNHFAASHQHEPLAIVDAVKQLAAGLAVAHREGIVHSDIKPANVMVDQRGKVKLIDFGTAVLADLRSEQAAHSPERVVNAPEAKTKLPQRAVYAQEAAQVLSPSYALQSELASPARDRYSLGRTIERLVFGQGRFKTQESMQELAPHLSYPFRELAEIAKQLVRKEPAQRISLERTKVLLEQLQDTEEAIEVIEDEIAQAS